MDKHSLSWLVPAAASTFCVMLLTIFTRRPLTYELSIYAGLNAYAFVPLALALALSYIWIMRGRLWAFNIMTMIFCVVNVIFISLPLIKGYYMYGQYDPSAFLGYSVDILRTGYTFYDDFYPLAHVLAAQLSLVLGIEPRFVFVLLGPTMWGVFALGTSLAVKQIEHYNDPLAAATVLGLACVFWLPAVATTGFGYPVPYMMTLELCPMVVYLFLRTGSASRTLALIIFLVSMPFYHPLTATILVVSLLVGSLFMARPLSSMFRSVSALIAVTLCAWVVYFSIFGNLVRDVSNMFTHEATITNVSATLGRLDLSPLGTIELWAKLYGLGAFALTLTALSYPILIKCAKVNGRLLTGLRIQYSFLLVSLTLMLAFFSVGGIGFTPFRFYWFAVLICLPSAIWTFLYFIRRMRDVRVARFISVTIIILLWVSSLVSLYPSPYLLTPTGEVTHQMILPEQWLYEHHPSYMIRVAPFTSYGTYGMYASVAGWNEYRSKNGYYELATNLPDHLAYGNVAEIGALYGSRTGNPTYVVFDTNFVQTYEELYPQLLRYTREDVQVFLSNGPVGKVYDNGDSQVLVIFGN